jgi:hypothetical protein
MKNKSAKSPEVSNKRMRYSTSPEDISVSEISENEIRQISVELFLSEFPGYSESMARSLVNCPFETGLSLLRLKKSGFKMSEEDPLVHAVIDVGDGNAVAFYNGGNYALVAGVAGALPWPAGDGPPPLGAAVPPGVAALPPAALGRFISTLPGVVNKSGAALTLFHFQNNESVHNAGVEIRAQPQFRRLSEVTAGAFGLAPSPSAVSFVQLERMDGVPQLLRGFCEL